MSSKRENMTFEKKSLDFLNGSKTDWKELAKDCVCFANAKGGDIMIGIEDRESLPPVGQVIDDRELPYTIHKRIAERTINTGITVTIEKATNKSEYIKVKVFENRQTIAATTDGKYYVRVADTCNPIPPDEIARLAADKNAFVWELQTTKHVPAIKVDEHKKRDFIRDVRASERVKDSVKQKSDEEILEHYFFQKDEYLTNLGILWIGQRADRASLLYPPIIQVIRYDQREKKVWKQLLDDYSLNPKEMLEWVLNEVPDWQESIEISEGMFRKNIHYYPEEVVRELVVNALVHRTYTTRGDIFINIFQDRLEIHSPGRLPYGVTPQNILNQSVRRNEHLSKVFHDLMLMEAEGSGYDLVYEKLLVSGQPIPIVQEPDDRVVVTVIKQYISEQVVRLMDKANSEYQLSQKETITLGLISQKQSFSAVELSKILNRRNEASLRSWLGQLLELGLVLKTGVRKGTQYAVNPEYIRTLGFKRKTTLKNIEDHRLEELLYKDIKTYPESGFGEIHDRIGKEINEWTVRKILKKMIEEGKVKKVGENRWRRYSIE